MVDLHRFPNQKPNLHSVFGWGGTVWKVISRGALIGAAQWLLLIPAGVIISSRAAMSVGAGSKPELVGATIGAGLISILTGGVALGMAVACLIVFAVVHLLGREMVAEQAIPTKKCLDCAEMVQAEARKCRFCGASFKTTSGGGGAA